MSTKLSDSTYFATADAIHTTMTVLRNRAIELTIGFDSVEYGTHNLRAIRTASNRVLFYVDGIQLAASAVPQFILANWSK